MNKVLLSLLTIFAIFSSLTLYAEEEEKINEHKAKVTAHIDKRIAFLNEFKTCVNGASKKGDIKACRSSHKEKMGSIKDDMHERRDKK